MVRRKRGSREKMEREGPVCVGEGEVVGLGFEVEINLESIKRTNASARLALDSLEV